MCGLHGIITNKRENNADDFINNAFTANMLRGVDSSGIAQVSIKENLYDYQKLPVSGNFFVQDSSASSMISSACSEKTLTMCHVRAATVGKVNMSNAHPFVVLQEDEGQTPRVVIGMHNGTLTNWRSHKSASKYTVDSEWAINLIAEEGFDAFEEIRGAFCFTWWDSDKNSVLNIARNDERPMYVVMLKSGGMAYASEAGMLFWLLERNRVEMDGPILELEAGFWYKFDVENPSDFDKIKLPKPTYSNTSYTRTYTSTPYSSPANTVMGKVSALLERIKKQGTNESNNVIALPSTKPAVPPARHPKASIMEYKAARDMGLLGQYAVFTPFMEWSEGIEGTAIVMDSEVSACVRGYNGTYTEDENWHCQVIGVQDDENEIVVILGEPKKIDTVETIH